MSLNEVRKASIYENQVLLQKMKVIFDFSFSEEIIVEELDFAWNIYLRELEYWIKTKNAAILFLKEPLLPSEAFFFESLRNVQYNLKFNIYTILEDFAKRNPAITFLGKAENPFHNNIIEIGGYNYNENLVFSPLLEMNPCLAFPPVYIEMIREKPLDFYFKDKYNNILSERDSLLISHPVSDKLKIVQDEEIFNNYNSLNLTGRLGEEERFLPIYTKDSIGKLYPLKLRNYFHRPHQYTIDEKGLLKSFNKEYYEELLKEYKEKFKENE